MSQLLCSDFLPGHFGEDFDNKSAPIFKKYKVFKFSVTFKGRGLVTAKMFTKEDKLPTLEELEVPEVTMGSTWLRAGTEGILELSAHC